MAEVNAQSPISPAPVTPALAASTSAGSTAAIAAGPDKVMTALIAKHRIEIDRVKMLDAKGQQEVFRELGVDPKALESHYGELERQSAELQRQDLAANKKVVATGWASFAAGLAGAIAITRSKFKIESPLVRRFVIGLTAPAAGLMGTFAASRIFAGKIRDESKVLGIEAKNAFERELAVALENREREGGKLPDVIVKAQASAPGVAANVPKRDASFTAQAAAEKAAPSTLQPSV
jgi:hypothetical protein